MLVRTRACVYVREGDGGRRREFTVCDVWFEGRVGKEKRKSCNFYSEFQLDNQNQTFASYTHVRAHTQSPISHLHVVVKM